MLGKGWGGVDFPENGSKSDGQPKPRLLMSPVRTTRSASDPPTVRSYSSGQSCLGSPVPATGTMGGPLGTGGGVSAAAVAATIAGVVSLVAAAVRSPRLLLTFSSAVGLSTFRSAVRRNWSTLYMRSCAAREVF